MKEKIQTLINFYRERSKREPIRFWLLSFILFVIFSITLIYFISLRAPSDFPKQSLFYVEEGQTLNQVAKNMSEQNFVRSAFWFKNAVILLKGEERIKEGEYFFEQSESTFEIARRLINGVFELESIKVTIHEGLNIFEIAKILDEKFPRFDKEEFLKIAENKEGYLFPDTYFFMPNTKTKDFIETMEDNFYKKIESLGGDIKNFSEPLEDVIKIASIIETESRTKESRRIISGILWRRLEINMPLQVDVTFKYINGKNSFNLTLEDLDIDSPYNTYKYTGLPPTPIANPGIDSIEAAINPLKSDYLFFLAGNNGDIHYATTFDEHVDNKRNFLKK